MLFSSLLLAAIVLQQPAAPAPTSNPDATTQAARGAKPSEGAPAAASPVAPAVSSALQALVKREFGSEFQLFPGQPAVTGDFDGDGAEDIAIPVRSQHPLKDAAELDFHAFSPEDDYFGYGDPGHAATTEFERWQDRKLIVVVHDWRAAKPKYKTLILNVPFDKLERARAGNKKRHQDVLDCSDDRSGETSLIFWDMKRKRWKWSPGDLLHDKDLSN